MTGNFSALLPMVCLAQVEGATPGPVLIGTALIGIALALLALWSLRRRRRDSARTRLREQWLATILRSIGDGVVATDAAGRVTFMNGVAQELTGWNEPDAAQRPLVKVFQTLDRTTRQSTENPIDKVVRDGHSVTNTDPVLLVAREGTERLVQSCAAPIRGDGGKVAGVVFVFRDVTARELGECALRASQEIFRLITEHVSDFIAVVDLEGRRLYTSNSFAQILPPRGDLYLSSSFIGVHPEDEARMRELFAETVRTGVGRRAEYRMFGAGGEVLEMESVSTVIRDTAGQPDKVLVVSRDVTARRQADERARREKIFSDTLINSLPGIFYLYDARRKILRWNKNLETVTGYTAADIETLDPLSYFPEEEKALVHARMLECFEEGAADIEVHLLAKNGGRFPYYVTGLRLMVEGQPCMLGMGIDISARVAAEETLRMEIEQRQQAEIALREAHASLEIKVIERTRDLAAANVRLLELDHLKSEFLATMSHELRTPLNSIIGFTGILRQGLAGPVNEEQKKQLGMVQSSSKHLLGLITDLLDLSRIESGRMEIARGEFRLSELLAEVMESLAPLAAQKKLRCETQLDQPGLVLCSDRQKCFQILLNLANNAVKFTDSGWVRIDARTTPESVAVCVSDTGIGIKPENMAHLFEAFRQVDGSARRIYEGTGLGLYLSRQLASMLGGTIKAESDFGIGSRFTFEAPREMPQESVHERQDSPRRR